jgi:glucose dehydrogenase
MRYSPLKQITPENAHRLTAQWTFQTGVVNAKLETTPASTAHPPWHHG